MVEAPVSLTVRRVCYALVTLIVAALLATVLAVYDASLHRTGFLSGWLLFAAIIVLTLYNLRKQLPFLPLGTATAWLELHIYLGWLSILLFALHTDLRVPGGLLEGALAALYVLVAGSGVVGLALARKLPARLSRRGEAVIFERIPLFRAQLRNRVETLALRAVDDTGSTSLADFYAARLRPFLDQPRNMWRHRIESNRGHHALMSEMAGLERYLNQCEREILHEMREIVATKDDLDYQYALQAALKRWLFVHVPLTYSLLILTLVHIAVVYAFLGDVP